AEISRALLVEQLKLDQQLAIIADLVGAGREMSVPEQRHLLLQRTVGGHHAVRPPSRHAASLKRGGAQPVEEAVDDRLHPARTAGLHLHADGFARRLGLARRRRTARREYLQARVVNAGMLERREVDVLYGLVIDHPPHGFDRRQGSQSVDILGRTTESGATEQMLRAR